MKPEPPPKFLRLDHLAFECKVRYLTVAGVVDRRLLLPDVAA